MRQLAFKIFLEGTEPRRNEDKASKYRKIGRSQFGIQGIIREQWSPKVLCKYVEMPDSKEIKFGLSNLAWIHNGVAEVK